MHSTILLLGSSMWVTKENVAIYLYKMYKKLLLLLFLLLPTTTSIKCAPFNQTFFLPKEREWVGWSEPVNRIRCKL